MSDFNGLIAVSFLGAFAFLAIFYGANATNNWADEIVTGMIEGAPIRSKREIPCCSTSGYSIKAAASLFGFHCHSGAPDR